MFIPAIVILRALLIVCKDISTEFLWHCCAVLSDTVLFTLKCCLVYCLSQLKRMIWLCTGHLALLLAAHTGCLGMLLPSYKSHFSPKFERVASRCRSWGLQNWGLYTKPSLQPWVSLEVVFSRKAAAIEMQIQSRERKQKALQPRGSTGKAAGAKPTPSTPNETAQNKPLHPAEPSEAPVVMQNYFEVSLYPWKFLISTLSGHWVEKSWCTQFAFQCSSQSYTKINQLEPKPRSEANSLIYNLILTFYASKQKKSR